MLTTKYLSEEEQRKFLKIAKTFGTPKHYLMCRLALETGLRIGELLNVKIKHIYNKKSFMALTLKQTSTKYREMPLKKGTQKLIRKMFRDKDLNKLVFGGRHNKKKPMRTAAAWRIIKEIMSICDLEHYNCHSLRHTFAMNMKKKNAHIMTIQYLLGHTSISNTLRYQHMYRKEIFKCVANVDNME